MAEILTFRSLDASAVAPAADVAAAEGVAAAAVAAAVVAAAVVAADVAVAAEAVGATAVEIAPLANNRASWIALLSWSNLREFHFLLREDYEMGNI